VLGWEDQVALEDAGTLATRPRRRRGRGGGTVDVVDRSPRALLFDLDGVITDTAAVHARAWKVLFDEFLQALAGEGGPPFREFTDDDYLRYVDGRRRYDGVATFLASRGIDLPAGTPEDDPDRRTVAGLGNRKDGYFRESLDRDGVRVFDDAVALLDAARSAGRRLAVVSASRNCEAILRRAGLLDRFDTRVTGVEAADWSLPGKPAPDTFLKAAELLGLEPPDAWVLEDAVSGVQAGRAGAFGLVVGVDRATNRDRLLDAGADVVVEDLRTLISDLAG
jgi:beta-phosphoglucomutase family hydrolase